MHLNHSSARRFKYVCFAIARSDTFKPRAGNPSSRKRSNTPAPNPLLSTMISIGRLDGGAASYSAFTAPESCIRSKLRHTVSGCTTGPWRLHRTLLSSPWRATSKPQTPAVSSCTFTSLLNACSTNATGITVSSSDGGKLPKTRTWYAGLSSPYRRCMSVTKSSETRGLSTQETCIVYQSSRKRVWVS